MLFLMVPLISKVGIKIFYPIDFIKNIFFEKQLEDAGNLVLCQGFPPPPPWAFLVWGDLRRTFESVTDADHSPRREHSRKSFDAENACLPFSLPPPSRLLFPHSFVRAVSSILVQSMVINWVDQASSSKSECNIIIIKQSCLPRTNV